MTGSPAEEYLAHLEAVIINSPAVTHCEVVREEAQGNHGLCRYRLSLVDGGLLEVFQLFQAGDEKTKCNKYSYHWQDATGDLIRRWDNAPHHPELDTHPRHVHVGTENKVDENEGTSFEDLLAYISDELLSDEDTQV